MIHSWANGTVEDTGPLTIKRMETIDDEVTVHARRFIQDAQRSGTPFFVWFNTTHMHFRTHTKPGAAARPAGGNRPTTTP